MLPVAEEKRLVNLLRTLTPEQLVVVKKNFLSLVRKASRGPRTAVALRVDLRRQLTREEVIGALVLYEPSEIDAIIVAVRKRQEAAETEAREIWRRAAKGRRRQHKGL